MSALVTVAGGVCLALLCYGAWLHAELAGLRHELDAARREAIRWQDSAENWRKAAKLSEQTGKGLEANARACLERESEAARRLAEALASAPPEAQTRSKDRDALVDALNVPLAAADSGVRNN